MSTGRPVAFMGGLLRRSARPEDFKGGASFPMPVGRFLAGDYLRRADIVLSRKAGSPYSWLIRRVTGSVFSHCALVFHTRDSADGFANNFVIEAGTDGVDLTNLRDYCMSSPYVIAIKRFSRPWFGDDVQRYVRGHLLDHIKDDYDYWRVVTMVRALIRSVVWRDLHPFEAQNRSRRWAWIRRGANANDFICSGLVQYGYFNALYKIARANARGEALGREGRSAVAHDMIGDPDGRTSHLVTPDLLPESLFSERLRGMLEIDGDGRFGSFSDMRRFWNGLHATTPRDIEETDRLDWLYVIRDGLVHQVSTYDEVKQLARPKILRRAKRFRLRGRVADAARA